MSTSASPIVERLEERRLLAGLPWMTVGDVTLSEGDAGGNHAEVVVSLSHPRPKQTVTVRFATQGGTAVAGSDFTSTSGTLSFPPGTDSRTILVPVTGDTTIEPDEMLVEVALPAQPARSGWSFIEVARRHGDYAQVGIAAGVSLDEAGRCREARLVYLSVGLAVGTKWTALFPMAAFGLMAWLWSAGARRSFGRVRGAHRSRRRH